MSGPRHFTRFVPDALTADDLDLIEFARRIVEANTDGEGSPDCGKGLRPSQRRWSIDWPAGQGAVRQGGSSRSSRW